MKVQSSYFAVALLVISGAATVRPRAAAASPLECVDAFPFSLLKTSGAVSKEAQSEAAKAVTAARIKQAKFMAIPMASEPGRLIYVEAVAPLSPNLPMLLMMPGINRAGKISDPSVIALLSQGYGFAEMSFSAHPYSVAMLPKDQAPYFKKRQPSLQDFADETAFVAKVLTEQMNLKNVVPISLSYSGSVSPLLKGFPLIIETVPMTSERAANVEGAKYRDSLKASEVFNPFFGASTTRYLLDQAYQTQWLDQAKLMIKDFGLPESRLQEMIDGYASLSRAAEEASWQKVQLPKETTRVFILALGEGPDLLISQIQAIQRLISEGQRLTVFAVAEAGHLVHVDQPLAFAKVVELTTHEQGVKSGTVHMIVPASAGHEMTVTTIEAGAPAAAALEKILKRLQAPNPKN